jgi:histidine ammonia-lyase
MPVVLDGRSLTIEDVIAVAAHHERVEVQDAVMARLAKARALVDEMAAGDEPHYGINTGFGALAEKKIPKDKVALLQQNLIESHAVGTGEPMPMPVARALLLLRAQTLAVGHSGCRPEILAALVALLNSGAAPYVPKKGSVGASGDLAPLAHTTLLLLGQGDAFVRTSTGQAQKVSAAEALSRAGLGPITLQAKEGLALINGTQAMVATGLFALHAAERCARLADLIGAMSCDALQGTDRAFDHRIHDARPHPGQSTSAKNLRALLADSALKLSHADRCTAPPATSSPMCARSSPASSTPPPTTRWSSSLATSTVATTTSSPAGTSTASRWRSPSTSSPSPPPSSRTSPSAASSSS